MKLSPSDMKFIIRMIERTPFKNLKPQALSLVRRLRVSRAKCVEEKRKRIVRGEKDEAKSKGPGQGDLVHFDFICGVKPLEFKDEA